MTTQGNDVALALVLALPLRLPFNSSQVSSEHTTNPSALISFTAHMPIREHTETVLIKRTA